MESATRLMTLYLLIGQGYLTRKPLDELIELHKELSKAYFEIFVLNPSRLVFMAVHYELERRLFESLSVPTNE